MKKREVIERIMTQHWDLVACGCWVCVEGRGAGCRPRAAYLHGEESSRALRLGAVGAPPRG